MAVKYRPTTTPTNAHSTQPVSYTHLDVYKRQEGEDVKPEFNDDFVKENLTASYGWESAEHGRESIREDLRQGQISQFVWNYMMENSTVSEVPQAVLDLSLIHISQIKKRLPLLFTRTGAETAPAVPP